MESLYNVTLLGLFFGIIGTTLGGFVGVFINFKSNKFISIILELAAGLMTSIICFDLIPHSLMFISITNLIFEILLGIIIMIYCNNFVNKKIVRYNVSSNLLKVGIVVGIGLAIHNFPEGLAIGAGFEASSKLGLSLAIAICIHDFPEGMAMAIPMKQGGMNRKKVILYTMLSGISTGIGALFGSTIGNISNEMIGASLGFAAGAMLYIIVCEILPESNNLYRGRKSKLGYILGFILGLMVIE